MNAGGGVIAGLRPVIFSSVIWALVFVGGIWVLWEREEAILEHLNDKAAGTLDLIHADLNAGVAEINRIANIVDGPFGDVAQPTMFCGKAEPWNQSQLTLINSAGADLCQRTHLMENPLVRILSQPFFQNGKEFRVDLRFDAVTDRLDDDRLRYRLTANRMPENIDHINLSMNQQATWHGVFLIERDVMLGEQMVALTISASVDAKVYQLSENWPWLMLFAVLLSVPFGLATLALVGRALDTVTLKATPGGGSSNRLQRFLAPGPSRLLDDVLRKSSTLELMTEILDQLPMRMCLLDQTGRIELVNRAWRDAYPHMSETEWIGWDYAEVCRQGMETGCLDSTAILQQLQRALDGEAIDFQHIYPCHGPDGTEEWFRVALRALGGSRPGRTLVVHDDVTEERRTLGLLQESERLLREFIDKAPLAVTISTPSGKLSMVNSFAAELMGRDAEKLEGATFAEVLPASSAKKFSDYLTEVVRTKDAVPFEDSFELPGGPRFLTGVRFPILNSAGEVVRIGSMALDQTHQRRVEARLGQQNLRLSMSERQAKIGHWQVSVRDKSIFWSEEAYRLHERDPGLPTPALDAALDYYLPQDRPRVGEYVRNSMADGSPFSFSARIMTEKGQIKDVLVQGTTEMENGEPKLVFGTIQDVSEMKTLARQRDQLFSLPLCMLAIADTTGKFVFLNTMWQETLGWSLTELKTRPFLEFVHPNDHVATVAEFRKLMEDPKHTTRHFQNRYRSKDGTWFWFSWSAVRGEDGLIYSSAIDVTPIKEAQVAKETSEQRWAAIYEATPDGVITIDTAGIIHNCNQAALEIFGYREDQLIGVNIGVLMPDATAHGHDGFIKAYLATGKSRLIRRKLEVVGKRANGDEFAMDISVGEWRLGEQLFFTGVVRDLSEQKMMQKRLAHTQKMEVIGRFTGGVAHDFNNLLTVIKGNLEVIADKDRDAAFDRQLARAQRAVTRGGELTQRLLAFARNQEARSSKVQTAQVLTGMVEMLGKFLGGKINFIVDIPSDLPDSMMDPVQFENAIVNLLINSRDAMPDGGTLVLRARPELLGEAEIVDGCSAGPHIRIEVSDGGIGMDAETLQKAVEPFFTTKQDGAGTGLGLASVVSFVRGLGGGIRLYSEPARGTTVELFIPSEAETASYSCAPSAQDGSDAESPVPGGGSRVLLVEDDTDLQEWAADLLADHDYQVATAANGTEALVELDRMMADGLPPHILFTDVVMPGKLNGFDLADDVRGRLPEVRVLVASGYADEALKDRGDDLMARRLLQKPYSGNRLLQEISRLRPN